ncbi:hypothetical protein GCM10022233_56750 [Streptomyces shaanxiensis]|uniref:Uncharacterized protein n=1 Tax=Streptomyces shaanxiensis TaxID=653357 RepID=A0ABP7VRQ2_9ACTN
MAAVWEDAAMPDHWSPIEVLRLCEDEDPDMRRDLRPSPDTEPPPTPCAEDFPPGWVACRDCHVAYEPGNPDEVKLHTEPVNCGQSCRCVGRPRCYTCRGSFCCCAAH